MRFYHIGFGIWLLMLLLSSINSLGIFNAPMPNSELNSSATQATITELTSDAAKSGDESFFSSIFGGVGAIAKGIKFILSVFYDSINLIAFGNQYGIDWRISGLFQAPYLFILAFGTWQFITGRAGKIMY